ncbi:MAG: HAD-IA family hydrolase [Spirochaetaceae bacterium]|nr:HAD-IA family hydrolase [Spirochaetaceae bacterium]
MTIAEKPLLGVLFDMDGVLVDSEDLTSAAVQRMYREWYGVEIPQSAFKPYIGAGEDMFIGGPARDYGLIIDLPAAKARAYEFYDELALKTEFVLAGALEYPRICKERGLKIAIASAADLVKVRINLRSLGLDTAFFDVVLTGSDMTRKKPFPDIYLLAAERIGVDPENCLVIEDAVNGIKAGVSAGARCLGITSSFDETVLFGAGASWCAPDLARAPLPWQLAGVSA